jgi:protoporphyrinogen oxidase
MKPSLAVVGGGITGLTAAYTLLRQGVDVTLFEVQPSIGGLSATHDFGPFRWDRFYHCILTSDEWLLALIDDLGLSPRLQWRKTEVGFYSRDALHRMTGPGDLLRFPCLSVLSKIRFGLGILYAAYLCNGSGLESVPLKEWVIRAFGHTVYREMWEPLLRCKLGELQSEASAAFLWSTIRRLYSTRDKGIQKREQLGYIEGGYRVVLDRLVEEVRALGGRIYLGVKLNHIEAIPDGIRVAARGAFKDFDGCLLTVPAPAILSIVRGLSQQYRARLSAPKYLGIVCAALVLKRSLSPYYLTNVTQDVPFTGIVEMTNLIDRASLTAGRTLVYLPKYTAPGDPLFELSDDQVWGRFSPALFRMHPTLQALEIESVHIFRERYVQPVPILNYSAYAPTIATGIPHLFVANSTQIVNDTLNNNAMTRIARKACAAVMEDLGKQARVQPVTTPVASPTHIAEVGI